MFTWQQKEGLTIRIQDNLTELQNWDKCHSTADYHLIVIIKSPPLAPLPHWFYLLLTQTQKGHHTGAEKRTELHSRKPPSISMSQADKRHSSPVTSFTIFYKKLIPACNQREGVFRALAPLLFLWPLKKSLSSLHQTQFLYWQLKPERERTPWPSQGVFASARGPGGESPV